MIGDILINDYISPSKPFCQPLGYCSELGIYLPWRTTQDQTAYRVPSKLDIGIAAQNMDFAICNNYPSPSSIFNCILSLALLSTDSANAPLLMVPMQSFDVFDFEGLHVQVVQPQYSN